MELRQFRAAFAAAGVVALLGACAGYSPDGFGTGAALADVKQVMGPPTGEYALPSGNKRIEYARGPYGKHTYMLDFDAGDRLLSWEQVLTEARFGAVAPGMRSQDVLMALGRPSALRPLAMRQLTLWSYRFDGPFCQLFHVDVNRAGQVAGTGYGPDPLCEVGKTERIP